jgi:hypothetical protein
MLALAQTDAWGAYARFVGQRSVDYNLMTNACWYATLAQRCFKCYFGCKPGAVHWKHIGRRGNKILGEEIDGGFDAISQLGASKVEPTHDLQPILS